MALPGIDASKSDREIQKGAREVLEPVRTYLLDKGGDGERRINAIEAIFKRLIQEARERFRSIHEVTSLISEIEAPAAGGRQVDRLPLEIESHTSNDQKRREPLPVRSWEGPEAHWRERKAKEQRPSQKSYSAPAYKDCNKDVPNVEDWICQETCQRLEQDDECRPIMASKGTQICRFFADLFTIKNLYLFRDRIRDATCEMPETESTSLPPEVASEPDSIAQAILAFHRYRFVGVDAALHETHQAIALSRFGRQIVTLRHNFNDESSKISRYILTAYPLAQGRSRDTSLKNYMIEWCYGVRPDHPDHRKFVKRYEYISRIARAHHYLASVFTDGFFLMRFPSFEKQINGIGDPAFKVICQHLTNTKLAAFFARLNRNVLQPLLNRSGINGLFIERIEMEDAHRYSVLQLFSPCQPKESENGSNLDSSTRESYRRALRANSEIEHQGGSIVEVAEEERRRVKRGAHR